MNVTAYFRILRPAQWLKNLMLLFPPFLGGTLLQAGLSGQAAVPLAAFCLASSGTYIFNDILDADRDAHHPQKSRRPIPAGQIGKFQAAIYATTLIVAAVTLGGLVSKSFLLLLLAYLAVTAGYSLRLKSQPIADIFCIAAGFVLRLQAGGVAFDVVISDWLFLSVFLLAIFLSIGKRFSERRDLGNEAVMHRESLHAYPDGFLEGALYMNGAAVLVCYALYTISFPGMVYTVPLCMFGLLRYMLRIKGGRTGDPTDALVRDPQLSLVGIGWILMVGWAVYG